MPSKLPQINIRLPEEDLARLERLIAALQALHPLAPVSQAMAIRAAMIALERELLPEPPARRRKPPAEQPFR